MPAPSRVRLCPKHSHGVREDEQFRGPRPPVGAGACPVCRAEATQTDEAVTALGAGTRTQFVEIGVNGAVEEYPAQSERARHLVAAHIARQRGETRRVEGAIAKLDRERPTLVALDHAKPGTDRRKAHDRHMRVVTGRSVGRRRSTDVVVSVPEIDFDTAMESGRQARERVLASFVDSEPSDTINQPTDFTVEGYTP